MMAENDPCVVSLVRLGAVKIVACWHFSFLINKSNRSRLEQWPQRRDLAWKRRKHSLATVLS